MPITCSFPPDDIYPALIGAFVEIQREIRIENQGFIGAIKAITHEQFAQTLCNISAENREKEIKKIITSARILEQEIIQILKQKIANDPNNTGFMSWIVGNGNNMENYYFQRLIILYRMRYGDIEAQRVIDIFSDANNNGKYKLFIEYSEAVDGSGLIIRRIWLKDDLKMRE